MTSPFQRLSHPRIVAIASAAPAYAPDQQTIFDQIYRPAFGPIEGAEKLFCHESVTRRHAFFNPAAVEGGTRLSTGERMKIWREGAYEIGHAVVRQVFEQVDAARIGSYVMVSNTGYDGHPPDLLLARHFGLSAHLRRTFIGHMGCQAAFNGLKVGLDALAARPREAVLVQCTEISSAHCRTSETSKEQIVAQSLFGDASAAVVLSNDSEAHPHAPEVMATHTETLYEHLERLNLSIGDEGFRMTLSAQVPKLIGNAIRAFVERMLAPLRVCVSDVRHWGVHPGGPKIIDAVAGALTLEPRATQASRDVLAEYGNCASPTILLILQRILDAERPRPGSFGVLLAFGPGLTLEGLVLRF